MQAPGSWAPPCAGPGPYGDRVRGLIAILWRAGLRISEALALTESDLDPKTGSVLVGAGQGRGSAGSRGGTIGESAGINRHGEGDENALHRRRSESRWPRVMRWRSVRAQRSVDRGRAGRVIEPRKLHRSSRCRRFPMCAEGNTAGGVIRESLVGPARSEIPGPRDELHAREPGDLVVAREVLVMPVLDGSRGGRLALGGPRGERLGGHPSMHDRRAKAPLVAELPHRPRRRRATECDHTNTSPTSPTTTKSFRRRSPIRPAVPAI